MSAADRTLRRFAGYMIKRAFNAMKADVNATLQPFGLRMVTFSALVVVVDNPGLSQSQLAEALSIEKPNLVMIVDELEGKALVARKRDKADRRAYCLKPTPAGQRLCAEALAAVDEHEARMMAGIGAHERVALASALKLMEGNGRDAHERASLA